MNNFAVAAVALMAVACNHDAWHQQYDPTAQKAKELQQEMAAELAKL